MYNALKLSQKSFNGCEGLDRGTPRSQRRNDIKFNSSMNHGVIFYFRFRVENNLLLLSIPIYVIVIKEDTMLVVNRHVWGHCAQLAS